MSPQTAGREAEIIGGLKNALERGESLDKAKQSFLNAGYTLKEVISASHKVSLPESSMSISRKEEVPAIPNRIPIQARKSKNSKKLIIILMVLSAIIFISAAILGILWESLFNS